MYNVSICNENSKDTCEIIVKVKKFGGSQRTHIDYNSVSLVGW